MPPTCGIRTPSITTRPFPSRWRARTATQGQTAREDLRMIEDAGFVLETPEGDAFTGDPFEGVPDAYPRAPLPLIEV